jgi:hypothetical protein
VQLSADSYFKKEENARLQKLPGVLSTYKNKTYIPIKKPSDTVSDKAQNQNIKKRHFLQNHFWRRHL